MTETAQAHGFSRVFLVAVLAEEAGGVTIALIWNDRWQATGWALDKVLKRQGCRKNFCARLPWMSVR